MKIPPKKKENEIPIPADVWDEYIERYGNLIGRIALQITGDRAICDVDDNISDLNMAAMSSFRYFCNQEKNRERGYTPRDCLNDPGFDKYTKTVLWHAKGAKGLKVEKKRHIRNCLSLDYVYRARDNGEFTLSDNLEASAVIVPSTFDNLKEEINEKANKREVERYRNSI